MKPLTGYIFLFIAISCGIIANSLAKISDGFTKLTPSVACILLMCVTMFSLAKGMYAFPVGFAYATYSAVTVASILIFGIIKYNQMPNAYGLIVIILIIAVVLGTASNGFAKGAQGFTVLLPSIITALTIVGCMYTLSLVTVSYTHLTLPTKA